VIAAALGLLFASATASAAQLKAPKQQAPGAGASVQAVPVFTWAPVKNAAKYQFQLAADDKFRSMVLGTGFGKGDFRTRNTAATIEEAVPNGTYYWRVRAISTKDRVGRWSTTRALTKGWTTPPEPLTADALSVSWPATPLVLRWTPVPHATKYVVTVTTDETLSNQVKSLGSTPVETQATSFTLPESLAPGKYYWAVTPVDAQGHKGARSRVASFDWSWPTGTGTRVTDLDPTEEVFDPQFSWGAIPGAAKYEVEVNSSQDFAVGSRWCCTDPTIGTSLSPTKPLANNRYYWRVRAIDSAGNAGQWNPGPDFDKSYDTTLRR
jgi:predicted phage tail protein